MLSCGSCDAAESALGRLVSARTDQAVAQQVDCSDDEPDAQTLRGVSCDFASLLYSKLVQQMQRTSPEEEEEEAESLKEGIQDFVTMFLPRAVAQGAHDPLSAYVYESLSARYGGAVDERA